MMSDSFMIRSSSPSSLTSVPDHLPNRMRSPAFTSSARSSPLSFSVPGPTEITSPSCGFSLAVSGMMMPPAVFSSAVTRRTRTRSCRGRKFMRSSPGTSFCDGLAPGAPRNRRSSGPLALPLEECQRSKASPRTRQGVGSTFRVRVLSHWTQRFFLPRGTAFMPSCGLRNGSRRRVSNHEAEREQRFAPADRGLRPHPRLAAHHRRDPVPHARPPRLLQTFVWQKLDRAPGFPELSRFLDFWRREIEGPLHSVRVASSALIRPAELRYANGQFTLH